MTDARPQHTPFEDVQGLAAGTALCALGIHLLTSAGLVTGGTAGVAALLAYVAGWNFGLLFFLVNLPFYAVAWARLGPRFTIVSFVVVAIVSGLTAVLPGYLAFATLSPLVAALFFGVAAGVGLLAIFRHGASLGGVGVVALLVQDRTGFRAGWVQLIFDAGLFVVAATVLDPRRMAFSLAGVATMNLVIAFNHRRDWYIAA